MIYDLIMNGFNWSTPMLVLIFSISIWELVWKLLAMWKAAGRKSQIWFVALAVFNTLGILSILYYFVFSEWKKNKKRK
jgi:hypothetical protein